MTDKLDSLFILQKEFQDKYGFWPELHDICSAGASEYLELWAKSSGKWWKKTQTSKKEQVEELVDILHFFLLSCLKLELSPQKLFDEYKKKLEINVKRQESGY